VLIFKDYSKFYGGKKILEVRDCRINHRLSWIRGLNGSGKTTLLKSIAGLIPFKGDITLNGLSLTKDPVKFRRLVTYSEAEPEYPLYLTGEELIGFTAGVRKVSQKEVDELTRLFGVAHYFASPCGGYSAGMVKKISLCMAFLGGPTLILLDEPFAFIDQEATQMLTDMIRKRTLGNTRIILTSHHDPGTENLETDVTYHIEDCTLIRIP
jgi:ABC-2 type transport system ATP-binding protein